MPIFESACQQCGSVQEFYAPHSDSPDPSCTCGGETKRLISTFGVVFTGPLSASKYNRDVQGGDPKARFQDEQVVWRTKSSKTGVPERCVLTTWEDRKRFMKDEGLIGIEDLGDLQATSDGKVGSGVGMRGQWA